MKDSCQGWTETTPGKAQWCPHPNCLNSEGWVFCRRKSWGVHLGLLTRGSPGSHCSSDLSQLALSVCYNKCNPGSELYYVAMSFLFCLKQFFCVTLAVLELTL